MYVVTTQSPSDILRLAERGATVRVTRSMTALPGRRPVPGLLIQYWAAEPGEIVPQTTWTYSETLAADAHGRVDLSGSLLAQLSKAKARIEMTHRSGSV